MPAPVRRPARAPGPALRLALVATLACALAPSPAARAQDASDLPALTGRVVDRAELLDPAREARLVATLEAHEAATSNQVVVATVPSLGGRDVAGYAIELANAWALGDAERDNGALLLVAPDERKVRIEVGRGLEGALTDARSGRIIRDEILPAFRDGDYPLGVERGVEAMLASIEGEYVAPPADDRARGADASDDVAAFVPFVFLAMIAVPELLRRAGRRRAANGAFPAGFAGLLATVVSGSLPVGLGAAALAFALLYAVGRGGGGPGRGGRRRRRTGYVGPVGGGFGGGLGGGFGGGGGGFGGGGGGFGGGGASGGW